MSEHEPIAVQGHYPLYTTEEAANSASPAGTSHTHTFDEVTYYMPDGLETFWHGDYTGNDSDPVDTGNDSDPVESVPSNDRIKISELVAGGSAQLNDEFIISRGNESFRISLNDIIQAVIEDPRLEAKIGTGTGGGNQGTIYDSGWVIAENSTTRTFEHNLGTTDFLVQVFHATSSDGADASLVDAQIDTSANLYGARVQTITTTTLDVQTGTGPTTGQWSELSSGTGGDGNAGAKNTWKNRYIRVLAIASLGSGTASNISGTVSGGVGGGFIDMIEMSARNRANYGEREPNSHTFPDYDSSTQVILGSMTRIKDGQGVVEHQPPQVMQEGSSDDIVASNNGFSLTANGLVTVEAQIFSGTTDEAYFYAYRFARSSSTSGTASSTSNTESTSTGGLIDAVMTSSSAQTPSYRYTGYDQDTQTVVVVVSDDPNNLKAVPIVDSTTKTNAALKITSITKAGAGPAIQRTTDYYIWIRPNGEVYQNGGLNNKSVGLLRFTKGSV